MKIICYTHMTMKDQNKIRDLIESELLKRKCSQADLGDSIGISQASIYKILHTNTVLSTPTLIKIAKYFNTTIGELIGEPSASADTSTFDANSPLSPRKIPVLNKTNCGKWHDFTDLSYPAGHADQYEYANTNDQHAFFIEATGDSMTGADIKEKDLLLVEPSKEVRSGHIVLACGDQGKSVKKFKRTDGMIVLIPMNDKYDPMILSAEQVERQNMRFYRITQTVRKL